MTDFELHLANWLTFVICIWVAISVLENITTESEDTLAVLIQKVLVSKVEWHLDIDISNIKTGVRKAVEASDDVRPTQNNRHRRFNYLMQLFDKTCL